MATTDLDPVPAGLSTPDAAIPVPPTASIVLEVEELEYARGDRVLFSALTFRVSAGQVLRIEGPNGSGKTSLLRILCGLARPARGRVSWHGAAASGNDAAVPMELSYLAHSDGLKGALTVRENLEFARRIGPGREGWPVIEALHRLGLYDVEDVWCQRLSAGQRRRVALARLLLTGARVWILDEPLTALDSDGVERFERLLSAHVAGGGLAVLTTHQPLRVAEASMSRIVLGR